MVATERLEQVPDNGSKARVDLLHRPGEAADKAPWPAAQAEYGGRMMPIAEYVQIWGDCEDA